MLQPLPATLRLLRRGEILGRICRARATKKGDAISAPGKRAGSCRHLQSVVRVWVARAHVEPLDEFAVGAGPLHGLLGERRTVLLIDDETIRTGVGELLAEWGAEVIAVSDHRQSLRGPPAQAIKRSTS
jgi:hypothetical protein